MPNSRGKCITVFLCICFASWSQASDMLEAYQRAELFMSHNLDKRVVNSSLQISWTGVGDHFTYQRELPTGQEFIFVDPAKNTVKLAFDHQKVAGILSSLSGKPYQPHQLPISRFRLTSNETNLAFYFDGENWECSATDYQCVQLPTKAISVAGHEVLSPNGEWIAYLQNYNIFIRSTSSEEVIQLTDDGEAYFDYRQQLSYIGQMIQSENKDFPVTVSAIWSPDSNKIFTNKVDQRDIEQFNILQSSPKSQLMPITYSFPYLRAGQEKLPTAQSFIIDIESGKKIPLQLPAYEYLYFGDNGPGDVWTRPIQWAEDNRFFITYKSRGSKKVQLWEVDAETGKARIIIEESSDTFIDDTTINPIIMNHGKELAWISERNGSAQVYIIDIETTKIKRQLTKEIGRIRTHNYDDENQIAYFEALGREPGRNPNKWYFYKVNYDGTGLALLTPEDAHHRRRLSPTKRYFIDRYSNVDQAPITVLRSTADGALVSKLEEADITGLRAINWCPPEWFNSKSRDGNHDIFGLIWRPSNFDPQLKYPVIELVYNSPSDAMWGEFRQGYDGIAQPIAELGFIVVKVDGLGSGQRSREFTHHAYQNVGDSGLTDRLAWIQAAAEKYPAFDLNRVGIMGNSHGGYNALRSMLMAPDFYKVGVAGSGPHDLRLEKAGIESWMGLDIGDHYVDQSNITHAHKLKGKLLLVHGEVDHNVPLMQTLRMADALTKANKDFDLLIIPNQGHFLRYNDNFIHKRWDYFVQHLLNKDPPQEFAISRP